MTTPTGGFSQGYGYQPPIDIGWLTRGWDVYKAQAGTWIAVMLLVGLILLPVIVLAAFATGYAQFLINTIHATQTGVPPQTGLSSLINQYASQALFSIVIGGPAYVGLGCYYCLALAQLRGEPVSVGTAFSAFRSVLPLLLAGFVVQFVVLIGSYLCVLPGLIAQGLFMFVPLLIVDRKVGPIAALTESVSLVRSQWLMAVVFFFLGQLLGGVGGLLCGVGAFVTYPLFLLGVATAYLALAYPSPPVNPSYGQASAGVWPPPPQAAPPSWGPPPGQSPPRTSLSGEPLDDTPPGTPPPGAS